MLGILKTALEKAGATEIAKTRRTGKNASEKVTFAIGSNKYAIAVNGSKYLFQEEHNGELMQIRHHDITSVPAIVKFALQYAEKYGTSAPKFEDLECGEAGGEMPQLAAEICAELDAALEQDEAQKGYLFTNFGKFQIVPHGHGCSSVLIGEKHIGDVQETKSKTIKKDGETIKEANGFQADYWYVLGGTHKRQNCREQRSLNEALKALASAENAIKFAAEIQQKGVACRAFYSGEHDSATLFFDLPRRQTHATVVVKIDELGRIADAVLRAPNHEVRIAATDGENLIEQALEILKIYQ